MAFSETTEKNRRGRSKGWHRGSMSLEPIGTPLKQYLEKIGLATTLKGWEALDLWKEIVGEAAAARSRAVAFESGQLIVEVDGAAWSSQLFILRREIRTRLNGRLGAQVIEDIQFIPSRGGRTV
jgi:predicted nucleic acid-binding Zn ribbon protein